MPDFVRSQPFEAFRPHATTAAAPTVLSAAAIEAGLLPAAGTAATTPELDYHKQKADGEEDDDEDEIVLAPTLAGLSLRPAQG